MIAALLSATTLEPFAIILASFLFWPLSVIVFLVVILAVTGKSFGIRHAYVRLLLRIFEWGKNQIKQESTMRRSASRRRLSQLNIDSGYISSDDEFEPIIAKDATTRLKELSYADAPISPYTGQKTAAYTCMADSFEFVQAGIEAIIDDDVTSRFKAEELPSWNMLSRTDAGFIYINFKLTLVYCIGFLFRYCVLFVCRLLLLIIGLSALVVSTTIIGFFRDGRGKRRAYWYASLIFNRICSRALSAIISFHNSQNKAKPGGICVANHTSPIDCIILSTDNCYAFVGQRHGALLGIIQRSLHRATSHIWFERELSNDRSAVSRHLREHVQDTNKLPILIFPEGTCINNTGVMMFKKGCFEVGGIIYPVAIKYDSRFGDPFWNSSKQGFFEYMISMMTSWAIVCDVWYLPPMTRQEGETSIAFAMRVKAEIAAAGGLVDLEWDGQLKRHFVKPELTELQRKNYSKRVSNALT